MRRPDVGFASGIWLVRRGVNDARDCRMNGFSYHTGAELDLVEFLVPHTQKILFGQRSS